MNETVETKGQGKGAAAAKAVWAVLLALCLVASLGLNIYQASQASVQNEKVNSFIDGQLERQAKEEEQENTYQEDGFKVGGEYEIRSTTHISNAYKNGDDSQLSQEDKDTLDMAKAVIDEVIEDGMGNYEKELAVYKWMVENIGGRNSGGSVISRPGGSTSAFTPHDVLTSHNAVCVGYATTFRLLMNMLGMNVHIVHNDYHSWDLVEIEEDQWYHVDIYSDAHGSLYGNFNMTDSICEMGHSWDGSALPVADSVKYSPAVQNSVMLDSLMEVPAQYKQAVDEGQRVAYYRFKTPLTDEEMAQADFLAMGLDSALDATIEGWHYFRAYWYPGEGEENILGLMLEKETEPDEETPNIDVTTPEGRAIVQAIAEAFGIDPETLGLGGGIDDGPIDMPVEINVPAAEVIGGGSSVIVD
ncbi:MAG: transglutaminase-like domain-containing protein [Oscillospiraceae bacterium]|nr:transglutaminase-like domain-containing protein [Oscillospiraceae bacterium]